MDLSRITTVQPRIRESWSAHPISVVRPGWRVLKYSELWIERDDRMGCFCVCSGWPGCGSVCASRVSSPARFGRLDLEIEVSLMPSGPPRPQ